MKDRWKYATRVTKWAVLFFAAFILTYDLAVSWNDVPNYVDSISGVLKRWGWAAPVVPFMGAGLIAHVFLSHDYRPFEWPKGPILLAFLHLFWLGLGFWTKPLWAGSDAGTFAAMLVSIVAGFVAYALLFPQRSPSRDEVVNP